MNTARAEKTLKQLLLVRDRKVVRAQRALATERAQLVKQQALLVTKQQAHKQAELDAQEQEQAWFAEAKATPLRSGQLEQLLAKVSIVRDQVAEKAQTVVRQEREIDEQKVSVDAALRDLQLAQRDYAKLELMHGKIQHTLVQLEQRKEDNQAEEMPHRSQRVLA
jgi:hypothetical protein